MIQHPSQHVEHHLWARVSWQRRIERPRSWSRGPRLSHSSTRTWTPVAMACARRGPHWLPRRREAHRAHTRQPVHDSDSDKGQGGVLTACANLPIQQTPDVQPLYCLKASTSTMNLRSCAGLKFAAPSTRSKYANPRKRVQARGSGCRHVSMMARAVGGQEEDPRSPQAAQRGFHGERTHAPAARTSLCRCTPAVG
jgi:hypothetical protein